MTMPRAEVEQYVLAILLAWPQENAWELAGLETSLFSVQVHRDIAVALIDVRDSGRRVHWKRVAGLLRKRGYSCAKDVKALVRSVGTPLGLTEYMSALHHARARRAS